MRSWMVGGVPIIPSAAVGSLRRRGDLALHVEALERREHLVAQHQHLLPERGGLDAPVAQLRDGRAERVGELADQARDGGLRERELLGGARDAAVADARLERNELGQHAMAKISPQADTGHGSLHAVRQSSRAVFLHFEFGKRRGLCPERDAGRKQKDLCHAWQRSG